jgi:hypothetical protein
MLIARWYCDTQKFVEICASYYQMKVFGVHKRMRFFNLQCVNLEIKEEITEEVKDRHVSGDWLAMHHSVWRGCVEAL